MLAEFSSKLACRIAKNDFNAEHLEVCAYGIEIALYTVLSTLGMLAIGYFANSFWQSMIIIAVYYIIQTLGGGYHARSHLTCFSTMAIGLSLAILFMKQSHSYEMTCFLTPLAFLYLICNPLHLHPNKSYLLPKKKKIEASSRLLTLLCMIMTIALLIISPLQGIAAATGIMCAAISRFAGKKQKYHE